MVCSGIVFGIIDYLEGPVQGRRECEDVRRHGTSTIKQAAYLKWGLI